MALNLKIKREEKVKRRNRYQTLIITDNTNKPRQPIVVAF